MIVGSAPHKNVHFYVVFPIRLNPQQAKPVKDPEVSSLDALKPGQLIRGYVKSVGEDGVLIR